MGALKRGSKAPGGLKMKPNKAIKIVVSISLAAIGIVVAVTAYQYTYSAKLERELDNKSSVLEQKSKELQRQSEQLNLTGAQKQDLQKQVDDLNKTKQDLEQQLQSKAADKLRLASVQTAQAAPAPKTVNYPNTGDAKAFIYQKESGNNPGAINKSSGACGLGQALPCSKMGCSLQDYGCQDAFFTNYMLARYGSWEKAKAFWILNHWW